MANGTARTLSLPFAFWVTGAAGNAAFMVAAQAFSSPLLLLAGLVYLIYSFPIVWASAKAYAGPGAFRMLAKLFMVTLAVVYAMTLMGMAMSRFLAERMG
ncbi:hypothetical protein [Magnetospirillum sp. UT-4]|uniref:hypothetical protein n=1 Tax=Magnetospirillum sp. UT-4 TaxID=2681467 RepID=UPI0013846D88|nr:hypothetical protein [Magnetospirillum sp. UT-4]CAA7614255.1 membrane hypothetical protein [Magnetospirillum sp. UT-4]